MHTAKEVRGRAGKFILCGLLITLPTSSPWAKGTPQKPFLVNPLTSNRLCNFKCQESIISLAAFRKQNLSFTGTQASELIHNQKSLKLEPALLRRWHT